MNQEEFERKLFQLHTLREQLERKLDTQLELAIAKQKSESNGKVAGELFRLSTELYDSLSAEMDKDRALFRLYCLKLQEGWNI